MRTGARESSGTLLSYRKFFLRVKRGIRRLGARGLGAGSLLTQWIVKYGYVPIVLIGMVALAIGIGVGEWKSGGTIVAEAPSSVVAETVVERRPPTVEVEPRPTMQLTAPVMAPRPTVESKLEPKPTVQVAALNPDVRLPDESDRPASKGYIMYANSPTNWTPVPLPADLGASRGPQ